MAGFRIPGPLQAGDADPINSRSACVAGFPLGPFGLNPAMSAESAFRLHSGDQFSELDSNVVNTFGFTPHAKADAQKGVKLVAIRLLPAGTVLYRIGSTMSGKNSLPTDQNFASSWWMRKHEFDRILAKGLQDTAWAARVLLAIAEVFGSKCDLQVCAETTVDLYAWIGEGKAIDRNGTAVSDLDTTAYWFPEKDLLQLYIPGLKEPHRGHSMLWKRAFTGRTTEPWLHIGTQKNLITSKSFVARADSKTILKSEKW